MLKERIISALSALAVLALAIHFLPQESLKWIVFVLWTVGAWEWSGFIKGYPRNFRLMYTFTLAVVMLMFTLGYMGKTATLGLLGVALVFWLFQLVQIKRYPVEFSNLYTLLAGVFVLLPSYASFDYLIKEQSLWMVFLLLVIIWAADVGAYFSGKAFGKNKLAPKVSPGKTKEGAWGGLLLALVIAVIAGYFMFDNYTIKAAGRMLTAGLGIVVLSVIGDLTVSMFKRNAGLKDSGVFLPGHGGVLDRIDSWCSGVVLFVFIILAFH